MARSCRSLESGLLRVGASQTVSSHYLPRRLARFTLDYPGVEVQVKVAYSSIVQEQVRSGALDCALIAGAALPGLSEQSATSTGVAT